jgi:hypothetical protein
MGKPGHPRHLIKKKRKSRATGRPRIRSIALARQIREFGVEVILERMGVVLPKLPAADPPRTVLTKEQSAYLEAALVRDMGIEKPIVLAWPQWLKAKATLHQVHEVVVNNIMEKHFAKLQKATKSYDYQQTQTVAGALGVDRVKVIAKFNELLEATRPLYRRVFDGPDDRVGHEICVEVPDLRTQTEAAKALLGLYGKEPPSQHVHEVGVTEDLKELTEAELKAEYARITLEAHKLGFGKVREEAIEGAITPA